MGNAKTFAVANFLAERLDLETSMTVTLDLSGADPLINVGTTAATTNVGYQMDVLDQRGGVDAGWDALPGFGGVQQPVYTGTVIRIAYERGAAPKAYFVAAEELFKAIACSVSRGARVEFWEITNGNAPLIANIVANGTLKASWDGNAYWPLQGRV